MMIAFVLSGFIIGCCLPAIASRFGKILPADPGRVLLTLWHKPRFPKAQTVEKNRRLMRLWRFLIAVSVLWGCGLGGLFMMAQIYLSPITALCAAGFITVVCLCIIIDDQYFLLPDFFTIPLLVAGFGASLIMPELSPADSFAGAVFGYAVSVLSVVLMWKKQTELGCGDVKMMTAVGAWLGVTGLNIALLMSFLIFALSAAWKNQRQGAYGPALGLAALFSFFLIYGL